MTTSFLRRRSMPLPRRLPRGHRIGEVWGRTIDLANAGVTNDQRADAARKVAVLRDHRRDLGVRYADLSDWGGHGLPPVVLAITGDKVTGCLHLAVNDLARDFLLNARRAINLIRRNPRMALAIALIPLDRFSANRDLSSSHRHSPDSFPARDSRLPCVHSTYRGHRCKGLSGKILEFCKIVKNVGKTTP